jgi:4'-phosphopantetheinyl transferase EntD
VTAAIDGLFADGVLTATAAPDAEPAALLPGERAFVERAIRSRQREFATGRLLARGLLSRLGVGGAPLLVAADRSPVWPPGVVGSISHCAGLCAVAVAPCRVARSLGLDVEPEEPLERELWPAILTEAELRRLERRPAWARGVLARLAFSAKEASYKATIGSAERPRGFRDLEIDWLGAGRFRARAAGRLRSLPELPGRFVRRDGFLLTGVAWRESAAPLGA